MPAYHKKLTAFSHSPGAKALLPGTAWVVTGYPTRIALEHLETKQAHFWDLDHTGPVENFTLELDLEKGQVSVFGTAPEGHFRHILRAEKGEITCTNLKPYKADVAPWKKPASRLTLGSAKKPDWDLVTRRGDLCEILPLWYALGQGLPATGKPFDKTAFYTHFQVHFRGILVPQLHDDLFQGITTNGEIDPLSLLSDGARAIPSLFTHFDGKALSLLKHVPKEFHAGRLTALPLSDTLTLDLTWSKKKLRTATFHATTPQTLTLDIPFTSFRMNGAMQKTSTPLHLDPGKTTLDRFTK